MRPVLRTLGMMLVGLLIFALLCESAFRLLPVSSATATGYRIDPKILTYPAHSNIQMATGWDLRNAQTLHTNNLGFVSDTEFVRDARAVALIGDSFVESSMLTSAQRPGAQLQRLLGAQRPVYAMGTPGASLLDYAERIRYASQKLGVRDFVVFIAAGDIRESLCAQGPACLDPDTLQPVAMPRIETDGLKRWARKSALAQYLFSQLRVNLAQVGPALQALPATLLPGQRASGAIPAQVSRGHAVLPAGVTERVASTFFERVRPYAARRLVLVLISPLADTKVEAADTENLKFAEMARAEGLTVVDMTETFHSHAAHSPLALRVGPYDHHLNALGMKLMAAAAAAALQAPAAATTTR